jgi:hypothetical protein
MSSTDDDRARRLAGALFDEVVAPLAAARRAAGRQAYFPLAGDAGAKSYYVTPVVRVMQQPVDFEFPGGGTAEGLVDALAEWWAAQGESGLAAMAPRLKEIAEALQEQVVKSDGSVSIFCYTMF